MEDLIYLNITQYFNGKPNIDIESLMKQLNEMDKSKLHDLFTESYNSLLKTKDL